MQPRIVHTAMAPQPSLLPPSQHVEDADAPSIYGDDDDAYDGIVDAYGGVEEEEESPQVLAPDNTAPRRPEVEPSSDSRFASAQVPQTYSDSAAAIGGQDDAIARALYAVERARTQIRTQKPAFNGFAAFDDGPSNTGYQLPSAPDRREPSSSSSRSAPTLPPGAYQPPARTYEQQGIPSERSREPAPHVQHPVAPANHFDAAWHRRATSLDPTVDAYNVPLPRHRATDPGAQNSNLPQPSNRYIPPSLNPNTGVPRRPIESNSPSQPYPAGDPRDHEQRLNAPAPSIQQTVTSVNGRNGPLPRHIPSKLTMPQPLYNPNGAPPPPPSRNAPPSEQPRSLFQPPQHGNGMTRPQIPQNYPPRQQQRDSPAPIPEPPRVQAQAIPMAVQDSRKVLRKKSTVHHHNFVADTKPAAMVTLDRADWLAPSTNHPPSRSKSEVRPPTAAVARVPLPPPPSMPIPQKNKKVPNRLSKKR